MSIGVGIFLFVVGAILKFAINGDLGGDVINLNLAGYILMVTGIVVFVIGLALMFKRRKTISSTRTYIDPATNERVDQQTLSDNSNIPPNL